MTIGTNRIKDLVPGQCNGRWAHGLNEIFGFTLYDSLGGAFTIQEVRAWVTNPTTGVVVESQVHTGAAFVAPWNGAGSAYNPATGVFTVQRVAGYVDGNLVRFRVQSTDGVNSSYMSFYVGIGTAPGEGAVPAVGRVVRPKDTKYLGRIMEVVGLPGSIKYRIELNDKTIGGEMRLKANEFEVISPSARIDQSIVVAE